MGITGSAVGLKFFVITDGIRTCEKMIKKKRKTHEKIVFLAKSKLNSIEVLVSKTSIDSCISHDNYFNVFKKFEIKEQIRNFNKKYV